MNHGFFTLSGVPGLDAVDDADTLVVPGRPDNVVPRGRAVREAIRRTHARGARVISLCTGSFALAEAGLLDGRRATTHWMWADAFRELHPRVRLEPDVLFVDEGDVLTAAGSAAALDLGLYVVRRDHGAEVANAVSRRLVFAAHRDGGQRQFVERPVPDVRDESLGPLLAWAQERLGEPLTVAGLAARAAVSPATLHRRFQAQLGTTPLAWLTGSGWHWRAGSSSAGRSGWTWWPRGAVWGRPRTSARACGARRDSARRPIGGVSGPAPGKR